MEGSRDEPADLLAGQSSQPPAPPPPPMSTALRIVVVAILVLMVTLPVVTVTVVFLRPLPLNQTALQEQMVAAALDRAKVASAAATPAVRELFNQPLLQTYLRELGSELADEPGDVLFDRFFAELDVAELVHSFGDLHPRTANCGFDLRVHMAQEHDIGTFYNQWQLQNLSLIPVDVANNPFVEWSEVNIFGFPPFRNVSAPDWPTASDRIFYTAINMYRGSAGNPQCGPIAAILRRSSLRRQILAAAFDTGFFQGICADNQTAGGFFSTPIAVCDAWPAGQRTLGVPPYLTHLVTPYLRFFNATQALVGPEHYPLLNLARLLVRLLSRNTYRQPDTALKLFFLENTLGYIEHDLALHLPLSSGIKMMVATFDNVWGTTLGDQLISWCRQHGWPLAWAYNPLMSFRCGPAGGPTCQVPHNFTEGFDAANRRILDPRVLAGVNASHTPQQVADWEQRWEALNVTGASHSELEAAWERLDADYGATGLSIEPLYAGACADGDCIGVTVDGKAECIC